jgi:amino acid transporter
VPTYAFIAAIAALVAAGLVHAAGRGFHPVPARHLAIMQSVTVLLVLRAFASGATAMTGIEAISNASSHCAHQRTMRRASRGGQPRWTSRATWCQSRWSA